MRVPDTAPLGGRIVMEAGAARAGEQVRVWLHSTPALLGLVTLDAAGQATVTIPADALLGAHRIVVQALDGSLVGWDGIWLVAASQAGPDGERLAVTGGNPNLPVVGGAAVLLMLFGVAALFAARSRRTWHAA
ncbi:MAG: hypothetical protein LBS56_02650 [Propionibacteriaceae bacterium]|nr:hypothetical protein [Propionibacteriaceae bacterium]